jgi:S-DNA-T family DNA segregation ATPase FtsK/SpoIIIE
VELTLIKKDVIYSYFLPEKHKGQYWINQINEYGDEERLTSIEGFENQWILKSNKKASVEDKNNHSIKEIAIEPNKFYSILLKNKEKALLYIEPITDDRRCYEKLLLPTQGNLTIGRAEDCHISFSNIFTSSKHAEILIKDDEISINDLNSINGTFVNGNRVENKVLEPGDTVYILGLKIIVGKGFIAINNPDGKMSYDETIFQKLLPQQVMVAVDEESADVDESADSSFYRSPRFKRDIEKAEFKIDPPPALGNLEETPLMLMLGPSITMGMASLFIGLYTLQNVLNTNGNIRNAIPTLAMSFSMLIGTVLWPILTKRYEKKKRIAREKLRQEKYREYLEEVRQEIISESVHQQDILHENFITIDDCVIRIKLRQRNLWERTREHNDFLKVRLGIGDLPLEADIKYPEKQFSLDNDNLQDELYKLAKEPKILQQVPVTLSLTENWISGMIGNRENVRDLTKGLIVQLTALHSYDELKMVFIYDEKESNYWNFVKWLPHISNDARSIRFLATNANEVKELSAYLEKEIVNRENITDEDDLKEIIPYYIVFAMSKDLAGRAEMTNLILKHKKNYGFSIITLYDELKYLPKECSMVIELDSDSNKIYDKNDITGKHIDFQPDVCLELDAEEQSIDLANIELDRFGAMHALPNMLTFMEMFGVGKIEHLNVLTRWKENNPTITLETPIGVDTTGELFKLDLHEKFHGPHGLIAGMTGSGKSEFIMTYILSLAVNYHPNEVAFILIDYKGGGMANAFTNLPHLAGTITNLDGTAVKRSLISIQSELKRRQAIFSETSKRVNTSNIDIYEYQRLFREGVVSEPLQHLFIISDEFAELKMQQPEFMAQLVSAARIGRSLGIHLILATQKPSGVVDDQIWSNSKFRICLKVQEKADSMDVIKRPDAAELSVTGRFYVQIGFNELFALGQSSWSGAPYFPSDRIEKKIDDSVVIIDNLGRIIKQVKPEKNIKLAHKPPKQLDEITNYLAKLAKEENISVRQLWLEPIPALIYLDELKQKYNIVKIPDCGLNPVIGEIDDPANQRQLVMTLPLTEEGNTIIYGAAGSGETNFLTTLIFSLLEDHTPAQLNLYILDFGSETLRAFVAAPHVGDILLSNDAEKINNLFKMLYREIGKRKKLFSDFGGDYQSYIKSTGKEIASIIVVIQNYSGFAEAYENKEEAVAYLTREGLKYGIFFVVTAQNTGAIRYRILQNFKQLFVLQLNDQADYSGVLGNVDGVYPSEYEGRGIFKNITTYEFQTARIYRKAENTFEFIRSYCTAYENKWTDLPAAKIPILPRKVNLDYLQREILHSNDKQTPIGIEKHSLNTAYYCFEDAYVNLVMSQSNDRANFVQGLAEVIAVKGKSELIVIDPESMFVKIEGSKYEYFEADFDKIIVRLFDTVVYRNNTFKEAIEKGTEPPTYDKMTCIIHPFTSLLSRISEDSKEKLKLLLEKGELNYNINFIVSDSVGNVSSIAYESWFKAKISLSDGIWIGNGITDQYQFKLSRITNDLYMEIGDNFGYSLNKGKVKLIKLLTSITDESEEELDG